MTSARLAELRRQRELVGEHLAWLDREIATAAAAEHPAPVAVPPSTADALVSEASATLRTAETFQPDPVGAARATRRGCLVFALALFALGWLVLSVIYFARYRDRSLFAAPRSAPAEASAPAQR